MFRQASLRALSARNVRLQNIRASTRSLVSTVLLNRAWENETLNSLKAELQKRGLSSGNKASLISRLRTFEEQQASGLADQPSSPSTRSTASVQARSASTATASSKPSATPPPPPASLAPANALTPKPQAAAASSTTSYPADVFDVKLPDLSAPPLEPSIQIPLSFDHYDSAVPDPVEEPTSTYSDIPKILVVGGEATRPAASNMVSITDLSAGTPISPIPEAEAVVADLEPNTATGIRGLVVDMLDDMGLPRSFDLPVPAPQKSAAALVPDTLDETAVPRTRELSSDERRGAIVLAASLFGAWVLAGIFGPQPAKTEAHGEAAHSNVSEAA